MTSLNPEIRSLSLRLHGGKAGVYWAVVYRDNRGREVFDRRVSSGALTGLRLPATPQAVVAALEAATAEIRERYGLPPAAGGPGAPGGGGGRYPRVRPGDSDTVPLSVVRDDP